MGTIAIDGPAGAGKSTIARILAKKLGYKYIDSGAIYRAITLLAIEQGVEAEDEIGLNRIANNIKIEFSPPDQNGINRVILNKVDVTDKLRGGIIDKNVSRIARVKGVRDALLIIQRRLAEDNNIVMDGRDIGSRVLPDAELKLYITASIEERAQRRFTELKEKDIDVDYEDIKSEIYKRDKLDKERKISPLVKAEDAFLLDTTDMSINEVLAKIIEIKKKVERDEDVSL
ncbi:(d)CMP kinase [Iocasia frigidifontis]|uniref:Cytidylate kinase n=1 Tax=Iocasia fonsfrigidae TaxID=2682810 RepID=A0A8A7KEY4_9FIRM|nr:(d)CMP kinase [Iocasia fonsfrigidae]QTL99971.1 (d)CMP kinase [Iocasia fonsfrigidae]